MTYWRMQLHPAEPGRAMEHIVTSLAAGYIGLDFDHDVGDLTKTTHEKLPEKQRKYWAFGHKMKVGDIVLIMAHHFPFALATISGEYNYIREKAPELGVWVRHFRKVKSVKYYADYEKDPHKWQRILMTGTISPLTDTKSKPFKLIREWVQQV